jgi:hypothetical protein
VYFSELSRAFNKPLEVEKPSASGASTKSVTAVVDRGSESKPAAGESGPQTAVVAATPEPSRRDKFRKKAADFFVWAEDNRPTIIMHIVIVAGIVCCVVVGLPIIVILVAVYFMQIPEKAPKGVEVLLAEIFPASFLYPNKCVIF